MSEGVDVWRPVAAERVVGADVLRILSVNQTPETEEWQFKTGESVRCERKRLSEGEYMVAVERYCDAADATGLEEKGEMPR